MNRTWSLSEIDYPESDGQPMGETPVHQSWIIRLLNLFQQRYRALPQVYVASDLMVYYTPGNIHDVFVPDLIVLLKSDRRERRVLKLWEERHAPNLVMEVTSRSTRASDGSSKRDLYARLGIVEYFLFDPLQEGRMPSLQGYRLSDLGRYQAIESDSQGRLCSEQTGVAFSINTELQLVLHDLETGELLLTDAEDAERRVEVERLAKESERRAKEAERRAKEAERQARLQAEARVRELEAEIKRLRDIP